ncbi:hypothetical protein AKJ37_02980 [candidate division MSBL1 archaeon SCGC-AAA259I09]|uniref:Uncharacterized protein n=1 Tax=candidate division MSBL1 archaeon SCGC-AAA259I09 TaxID=1698267 RepID=A0A133UT84_9EURY|nr:hypothetical protein AKJ37_02980 [candidate division MSBL1 archaeon SCGC-AAA259I09]
MISRFRTFYWNEESVNISNSGSTDKIKYKFSLDTETYFEIMGFASYSYMNDKITKYSGIMAGKRTLGQYIENFIYGKLAEEAFKKFLSKNFEIDVLTDSDLAGFIDGDYLPDIVSFRESGEEWRQANFWVDVKQIRRDQRWLLVPSPKGSKPRNYDTYVAVWVGLPDHHIAWFLSNVEVAEKKFGENWRDLTSELEKRIDEIKCEVAGFAPWEDLQRILNNPKGENEVLDEKYGEDRWNYYDGNTKLYDPTDEDWSGSEVNENAGIFKDSLRNSESEWLGFKEKLFENERQIPSLELKYETEKGKERGRAISRSCKVFKDEPPSSGIGKILENLYYKLYDAWKDDALSEGVLENFYEEVVGKIYDKKGEGTTGDREVRKFFNWRKEDVCTPTDFEEKFSELCSKIKKDPEAKLKELHKKINEDRSKLLPPFGWKPADDYRTVYSRSLDYQIEKIKEKNGRLERDKSWFQEDLNEYNP